MITLIEAKGYRALRYVRQPLGNFAVLVGPNASGKTTFLDVPAFLGRLVADGIDAAVGERSKNFQDLTWRREGTTFELAVEVSIPHERRRNLSESYDTARYEVGLGLNGSDEVSLLTERVLLKQSSAQPPRPRALFPESAMPPDTILTQKLVAKAGAKQVISKVADGNDNFYDETKTKGTSYNPSFKLGPRKSALANLPADESKFPVATWLKDYLTEGVQRLVLNSEHIRSASPPNQGRRFKRDGSNLAWVAANLQKDDPDRFNDWMDHLSTALRDFESLRVVVREDDKHSYMMLKYRGGLEVPSWMASDGTMRMLALTLPAYLPDFRGVFLIEEPENGIHPRAVEAMLQSLSSVYDAQILLATHSPVILSSTPAEKVLCFAKDRDGATDIVVGSNHPALAAWKGETNLGTLFAAGVLG
ncbi:MAG: ATP-binding protein [Deltaproteobacteria bacterium]|nr:ATP-binding protein [Deltaproteobacteria bacterium]